MAKSKLPLFIIGGIVIILLFAMVSTYNSLVSKEEKVKLQWNEVQNVYQRRLDLIPNIVNVVKGAADFEQTTLEKITETRTRASQVTLSANEATGDNFQKVQAAQDSLASATNRLIVSIEKYPSLKGTAAFSGLQTQLEGTERRIKVARKDFNEAIADYNKSVRTFPANVISKLLGFSPKEGFVADPNADKAIEIKFN